MFPHSPSKTTTFARILFGALLLGLVLLNFSFKWIQAFSYAPDLGGFERNVIWGIQQILLGKPLYTDPASGNFAFIQYMPVYYYLMAGLARLFSIDPLHTHSLYSLARGFNLMASLLSVALVYLSCRKPFKVAKDIALSLSALAFLFLEKFSISGRPDSLKVLLFMGLVFVLLQFSVWRKRYVFLLSILLSTLCFFVKQDGLVFCGILPLVLLLQRDNKGFVFSGFINAVFTALLLALIQFQTSGYFFSNVVGGLQNGLSLSWFVGAFGNYFGVMALLFGTALVLSYEFALDKPVLLHVLAAAFVFSFFPQLFFSLKFGSGTNYFMECTLVSFLILGVFLSRFPARHAFMRSESKWLLATALVAMLFLTSSFHWFTAVFMHQEARLRNTYNDQLKVKNWIQQQSSTPDYTVMIMLNKQWEDHFTTLFSSHVVSPTMDVALQVFTAKGADRFAPLANNIAKGNIDYLISDAPSVPRHFGLSYAHYRLVNQYSGYYIFTSAKP